MKVCSKCKIEKEEHLFDKSSLHKGGLYSSCKECNKLRHKKKFATHIKAYKKTISEIGCTVCGGNHPHTLEVHHLHKSFKRFNRSQNHVYNLEDLEAGTAIILCANCHSIFHGHFGGKNAPFPEQTIESVCEIVNTELNRCA